jgi:hypothetical protein
VDAPGHLDGASWNERNRRTKVRTEKDLGEEQGGALDVVREGHWEGAGCGDAGTKEEEGDQEKGERHEVRGCGRAHGGERAGDYGVLERISTGYIPMSAVAAASKEIMLTRFADGCGSVRSPPRV